MRTKYRFSHRSDDGKTYYWESTNRLCGDSRIEQIRANVNWFWGRDYGLTRED
jgi:hypothetical protein